MVTLSLWTLLTSGRLRERRCNASYEGASEGCPRSLKCLPQQQKESCDGITRSRFKKKKKKHTLTEVQRKERLVKCWLLLAHVTKREHLTTVFTDEKPFAVEAYHYFQLLVVCACSNMTASHNSLSAVVIVWDGVTAMGHTLLVFVPKGTKIDTNHKEILESHLLPWSQSHFGKQFWKLQQNSAPAPKSKKSQQWCHTNMPKFTPSEEQLQNYSRT